MSLDWARLLPALAFALLLLIAAAYDVRERRIPNWAVLALAGVFFIAAMLGLASQGWLASLSAFGIALAGTGALYMLGWLGAGDSKLFSATALFLGLGNLALLTCATAIAGGVLAIGCLAFRRKAAVGDRAGDDPKSGIPYGVAIALGGLFTAIYARVLWPQSVS